MSTSDFEIEFKREVNGESDGRDWKVIPHIFEDVKRMFKHSLLEEVTLSYADNIVIRFRKKPDAET